MRMRQQVLIPVAVIVVSGLAVLWQLRPDAQSPAILSEVSLRQPEDQNDTSTQLSQAVFADVTSASGVDFRYRNGEQAEYFTILESLGGGSPSSIMTVTACLIFLPPEGAVLVSVRMRRFRAVRGDCIATRETSGFRM